MEQGVRHITEEWLLRIRVDRADAAASLAEVDRSVVQLCIAFSGESQGRNGIRLRWKQQKVRQC